MISNYFWTSNMASILFCNSDFSSIGSSIKGVCEAKCGKEDGGQGVDFFNSGAVNPYRLCEE